MPAAQIIIETKVNPKGIQKGLKQAEKSVTGFRNRFNKAIKDTQLAFAGWALSILFFGMFIQRTFQQIMNSALGSFNQIMSSVEGTTTNIAILGAQFKFLSFTVGQAINQALGPLMPLIINMIQNISRWIEKHPKLTAILIIGGIAVGFLLFMIGSLALAIPGLITMFTLAGKALTILKGKGILGVAKAIGVNLAKSVALLGKSLLKLLTNPIVLLIALVVFLVVKFKDWRGALAQIIVWTLKFWKNVAKGIFGIAALFTWLFDNVIVKGFNWAVNKLIDGINILLAPLRLLADLIGIKIPKIGPVNIKTNLTEGIVDLSSSVERKFNKQIKEWQEVADEFKRESIFGIPLGGGAGAGGGTVVNQTFEAGAFSDAESLEKQADAAGNATKEAMGMFEGTALGRSVQGLITG